LQTTANLTRIFPLYIFVQADYLYYENGAKIVGFRYNAWGTFNTDKANTTVCTDLFLRASLFRYRGYIYDYETNFYYLQSRYYDPEIGRFINADDISYLGDGTPISYNLFSYCGNNPVMGYDPTGHWDWRKITDKLVTIGIALASVAVGVAVGVAVTATTKGSVSSGIAAGVAAGVGTNAVLNNAVNAAYYTFSDNEVSFEESEKLGSQYARDGYLTRWDRLDYARYKTQGASYLGGGWAYYSEYSIHMYGWLLTKSAFGNPEHPLYDIAESSHYANIDVGRIDSRPEIKIPTILYGVFGGF